jgi:hypothetical protein
MRARVALAPVGVRVVVAEVAEKVVESPLGRGSRVPRLVALRSYVQSQQQQHETVAAKRGEERQERRERPDVLRVGCGGSDGWVSVVFITAMGASGTRGVWGQRDVCEESIVLR